MTRLPSWSYREVPGPILTVWDAGLDPGPDAATITGPMARRMYEVLSAAYEAQRQPDPVPDAEPDGPSMGDLREWARAARLLAHDIDGWTER